MKWFLKNFRITWFSFVACVTFRKTRQNVIVQDGIQQILVETHPKTIGDAPRGDPGWGLLMELPGDQ